MFISIDMDAFYCGVEEHIAPKLRGEPFCVVQKHCVATLSYPARQFGLKKLANVNAVQRQFPEMQLINGEDISKYRKAGNDIFKWVQNVCGGIPIERLGLEEMRLNLRPIIEQASTKLADLKQLKSYMEDPDFMDEVAARGVTFYLGDSEVECPNFYFNFDGFTWPVGHEMLKTSTNLKSYIAGHLAVYIRDRMWLEIGYSCSIGVASSKHLAKMVGNCNKPRGVTVLQPGSEPDFIKSLNASKVPGLGSASRQALQLDNNSTVEDILVKYEKSEFLTRTRPILGDAAAKSLWMLLNAVDTPESLEIRPYTLPVQISVEESYAFPCPPSLWKAELNKLSACLLKQAMVDWYDDDLREWLKVPRNCRVSVIFPKLGYKRRSKTTAYTWDLYDNPRKVGATLPDCLYDLLLKVTSSHKLAPRVINVGLLSS